MKPNILIILSDQLRRNALGCYGDDMIRTPNIDALAKSGTLFSSACSTYPVCVPFRFTLMTGQYAHTRMLPTLGWRMSPAERTLADEFNDAGYETAYFGKWHLYGGQVNIPGYCSREENLKPVPRSHQGRWQHWRGFDLCNAPFDTNYFIDDDPVPHKMKGYQTDGLFDLTINFLDRQRDESKPFCCLLSVEPPHNPFEAPEELETKWLATDCLLPGNFLLKEKSNLEVNTDSSAVDESYRESLVRDRKLYYAMVENLDENVGKMLRYLKVKKLLDSTVILFMADHGELGGAHCLVHKQFPYEESIGIPLIASGPGIPEGQIDTPVSTEDIFPTILGLAGISLRRKMPGEDFSAQIMRGGRNLNRTGVLLQLVWEPRKSASFCGQIWRGFRSQHYKYTVLGDIVNGLKAWQFFDLKNDPLEINNLIHESGYQERIRQHHHWMKMRMDDVEDDAVRLLIDNNV